MAIRKKQPKSSKPKKGGDNTTWFAEIRDELSRRDKECQLKFGPSNEFVRPESIDPYKYPNVEAFKRANPFKVSTKTCKLIKHTSTTTDLNKRYFEKPRFKPQCSALGGIWHEQDVNRKNKYDMGVCWTNADDAHCGTKYQVPSLLRPMNVRTKNLGDIITQTQKACDTDEKCAFVKTGKYSYDCFAKKTVQKKQGRVADPPHDMPTDVTKGNIEKYMYNWYVNKSPSTPPETTELFGKGNRCVSKQAEDDDDPISGTPQNKYFDRIKRRIKMLNPMSNHDVYELRRYMSDEDYKKYRREYALARSMSQLTEEKKDELQKKYIPDYFSDSAIEHLKIIQDEEEGDDKGSGLTPSIPQSVVNMVMKSIAKQGTSATNRGVLAWHSTGSGKTCTATGVIDSFWDDEGRDIIFASSLDAIASNPDYKFHECAMNLYPRFQNEPFAGETKEETMGNIAAAFDKRGVRFLSFAKLSNRVKKTEEYKKTLKGGSKVTKGKTVATAKPAVKIAKDDYVDLNKSILIIDEVHNLFRPLATQREQHEYLEKQLVDPKKFPNLKIVILTATPGDNIPDVLKLLNIIRDNKKPEIKPPDIENADDIKRFKNDIRGMISFFDMSSDSTKFPEVQDNDPIKYPMSMTQFERYVEAYKEVKADGKSFEKLAKLNQTNKYWAPARRYSNMLFNFDKNMALSDFSSKMPALLQKIQAEPKAKHYVYSAFFENRGYGGHGVLAVAKELDKLGYTKMTVAEAKRLNKAGKLPEKKKRYVLAITNELNMKGGAAAKKKPTKGKTSKDDDDEASKVTASTGENLHELIKIYNSKENKDGEYIHCFLASQGFNEGIDLKGVRHIHIFEPLITWASDKQTLGRAARYCSHADLDRDNGEWKVQIHRYMSDLPLELKRPSFNNEVNKDKQLREQLTYYESSLEMLDKKTQKSEIKDTKAEIASLKKQLKDVDKEMRHKKKLDLENLKNIDEVIYQESKERMKQLLVVYQAMKEAAIDCQILQRFHTSTGNKITCETFEKAAASPSPPRGIMNIFDPFFK